MHRGSQPGQTSSAEVKKRDLRAELLAAEAEARDKKRKAEGKPPLAVENGAADEEANKRRKLLQEALEMDKDEDDEAVMNDPVYLLVSALAHSSNLYGSSVLPTHHGQF